MARSKHMCAILFVCLLLLSTSCSQEIDEPLLDYSGTFGVQLQFADGRNQLLISHYYPIGFGYSAYYTLDGTDPNINGIEYTGLVPVDNSVNLRVVLKKDGKPISVVFSYLIELRPIDTPMIDTTESVRNPSYDGVKKIDSSTWSIPEGNSISLYVFNETEVHYTIDGTPPTLDSPKYEDGIRITNSCTLKVRSFPDSSYDAPSEILTADIVLRLKRPIFSHESTKFLYNEERPAIEITSPDEAYISYILNSSEEVKSSEYRKNYTGPIDLNVRHIIDAFHNISSRTYRITAIATGKEGFLDSLQTTVDYPVIGQAGGFLIYDKGNYTDGWRYLEVTPNYIREKDDKIVCQTYEEDLLDYSIKTRDYVFGFERSEQDLHLSNYNNGWVNTEEIVKLFGDEAFISTDLWDTRTTPFYAAKLCSDLIYNDYDDWYLPTFTEGEYIVKNCYNGLAYINNLYFWVFGAYSNPIIFRMFLLWPSWSSQRGSESNPVLAVRRF